MNLSGKVAIVTGVSSSRGIGRAAALALATAGADMVVIAGHNIEGAREVAREIETLGRRSLALRVDVTDGRQIVHAVEETLAHFGRIDILVNNAGATQKVGLLEMTEDDWGHIIAVNLKGTFLFTKAVLPVMIKQRSGRIISISSISAKRGGGYYGGAHYCAAKAGVLGFAKAVAREMAPYGITSNVICPGTIDTDFMGGPLLPERKEAILRDLPLGRLGRPEDIANAILFLASDEAEWITGEVMDVNGGAHID
ncbi:MAG: 3-oxoacyl-ACP reductase FabG [Chloroflexi bacterium]|nr:3-oxoacyl-ACP reductase FabG [Chloroflexota bacterium]MCL5075682.1 3-oxoacyl-ACP reductase FabG [Chloroflexota bacterium]